MQRILLRIIRVVFIRLSPYELCKKSVDILSRISHFNDLVSEVHQAFAEQTGAEMTVMEGGEHWFHTEEQMAFLDQWIRSGMPNA